MDYELAKRLKDAGLKTKDTYVVISEDYCENCNDYHHEYAPTLSALIEACGSSFGGSNCLQKPYNIHRNRLKTLAFYY
jgi:hypothetical protein